jgi:formylglycine-generating enzyme required for sulfatase activity
MVTRMSARSRAGASLLAGAGFVVLTGCELILGLGHDTDLPPDAGAPAPDASSSDAAADAIAANAIAANCHPDGPGLTDCGPTQRSCCATAQIIGGQFSRGYDGVTNPDPTNTALVQSFRMDVFEVTVGRFRHFLDAVRAGWRPAAGSGKHTHLPQGGVNGGQEPGWEDSWRPQLEALLTPQPSGESRLSCQKLSSWTEAAGDHEYRPVGCVTWYEAYAFCIWDGGFLPTEAEWNYAASGGGQQRVYPWSSPHDSVTFDCSYANYGFNGLAPICSDAGAKDVGAESPKGDNLWGVTDLSGNVWEWVLDGYVSKYENPCSDCAELSDTTERMLRGGSFLWGKESQTTSTRVNTTPGTRGAEGGVRCARAP